MPTKLVTTTIIVTFMLALPTLVNSQSRLESGNYAIIDSNIDSTSGISESSNYSLLSSLNPTSDSRLESGNYALGSGFPNGIQANVPLIRCFDADSTDLTTECTDPAQTAAVGGDDTIVGDGMIGVCGSPGCYDRAKIEIDPQGNPSDTLYLVALSDDSFANNIYYLRNDKTLSTTLSFANYMTICEIQGYDTNDSACNDDTDLNWSQDKQEFNVIGIQSDTTWYVMARALSGDFTETGFSPIKNAATQLPTITGDIDIASTDTETTSPYEISLGTLTQTVTEASDYLWVDMSTNAQQGISAYLSDSNTGLYSADANFTISSEDEDLDIGDSDGGFGLQALNASQDSGGVLLTESNFSLINNVVKGISPTPQRVFYTEDNSPNQGPITNGRGQITIKARSAIAVPAGSYSTVVTLTLTSNW